MSGSPGYDDRTERRRLHNHESEDRPPSVAFLDDVFWATAGMLVLALPALVSVLRAGYRVQSTASLVFAVVCLTAATLRGGWIDVGYAWPERSLRSLAGRAVWYSLVVAAGTHGGAWLWNVGGAAPALAVTAIGAGIGTAAVPVLTAQFD